MTDPCGVCVQRFDTGPEAHQGHKKDPIQTISFKRDSGKKQKYRRQWYFALLAGNGVDSIEKWTSVKDGWQGTLNPPVFYWTGTDC